MLVAIIGGGTEDERHLLRIAARSGHEFAFYRPRPGGSYQLGDQEQLAWVVNDLGSRPARQGIVA